MSQPPRSAEAPPGAPALVVVDADEQGRAETERALRRRFGGDYRVLAADSVGSGLRLLERLARRDDAVALVAADLHLPGMDGVAFLERAHGLHPRAGRVLLVAMDENHTRIPLTELETLRRATAFGRIDFSVVKGWVTPEEWLYPQVQEALTAWTRVNGPRHLVYCVLGEQWDQRSSEVRDLLTRNGVPFEFCDVRSERGRQLARELGLAGDRLPALIHHDGRVLQDPTLAEVAATHGINTRVPDGTFDLAVLGAGPAGLAAAVYGASEGLRTVVVEPLAIGGQAATSSMIRNYLGFARGIGGAELAHRAWEQAVLLGAEFVFSQPAARLTASGDVRTIGLRDGSEVLARSVVVAAGVSYRRLQIPALERLAGAGVFYGAGGAEAPAMAGADVYVVGGANSAGQAALHLAAFARRVTLLVRGGSLAAGMSDYLVRQVEAATSIDVRLGTRVVDGRGSARLETLTLEDMETGRCEEVAADAVFVLIGAEPRTEWLRGTVQLDDHGFVLTGRDLPPGTWSLPRPPLPFETTVPGVLAVGDVRYGSVKRVAGAVGEGSVAVGSVHRYLSEYSVGTSSAR